MPLDHSRFHKLDIENHALQPCNHAILSVFYGKGGGGEEGGGGVHGATIIYATKCGQAQKPFVTGPRCLILLGSEGVGYWKVKGLEPLKAKL